MPYRYDAFVSGNYYHVFNRGANRENIFFSETNFIYCLKLIQKYVKKYDVTVIAYCLMPNHYHLLLRQDSEVSLSKFVNVLFNAYVQAVNNQLGRKGTLFEGRFRHVHVDRDEYLVHLCRYIHLNPVKAHLVSRPEDWVYSNYREWVGLRQGSLKNTEFILSYFESESEYQEFVIDYQIEKELEEKLQKYLLD